MTRLRGTEVLATARQIDHWVRKGYLRPENPNPGPGRAYEWSAREVRTAEIMALAVAAGVAPATAILVARMGGDDVLVRRGIRIDVCVTCAGGVTCSRHREEN